MRFPITIGEATCELRISWYHIAPILLNLSQPGDAQISLDTTRPWNTHHDSLQATSRGVLIPSMPAVERSGNLEEKQLTLICDSVSRRTTRVGVHHLLLCPIFRTTSLQNIVQIADYRFFTWRLAIFQSYLCNLVYGFTHWRWGRWWWRRSRCRSRRRRRRRWRRIWFFRLCWHDSRRLCDVVWTRSLANTGEERIMEVCGTSLQYFRF